MRLESCNIIPGLRWLLEKTEDRSNNWQSDFTVQPVGKWGCHVIISESEIRGSPMPSHAKGYLKFKVLSHSE